VLPGRSSDRRYDDAMSAEPAEPYEVIHVRGHALAIVPLDDLDDLDERLAVAKHLADKAAGNVTGVTDDELDEAMKRHREATA
jgi:hypothetical protein